MEKRNDRYDSKTEATRILEMSELVSLRYTSLQNVIAKLAKRIDRMAALIENQRSMERKFDDALAIGILVSASDVSELFPKVAVIKTIIDRNIKWEGISSRLFQ